jgi:hypothetical protein
VEEVGEGREEVGLAEDDDTLSNEVVGGSVEPMVDQQGCQSVLVEDNLETAKAVSTTRQLSSLTARRLAAHRLFGVSSQLALLSNKTVRTSESERSKQIEEFLPRHTSKRVGNR